MHGLGTLIIKDKSKYIGEFKNNLYHGQGTFTSNEGDKYVGEWKDGEMDGKGTFTKPDGEQYVGEWKDGEMEGKGTFTKPNGEQYVGEFKKSKKTMARAVTYFHLEKSTLGNTKTMYMTVKELLPNLMEKKIRFI